MKKFNRRSTAEDVTHGLDLTGKNIVITGVNSGLGFESMRVLAMRGAHIIALARTEEKAATACAQVEGETTPMGCELSDFQSVKDCAMAIKALDIPIDVLMCNAGIMALDTLQQAHGLELQFATNHMGHYILIRHLLPQLERAEAGRIVLLSSMGHIQAPKGGIDFDDLASEKNYDPWKTYGRAKLANILCAKALAKELKHTNVTVNALHPGVIKTNLDRNANSLFMSVINLFATVIERTVAQGASTQCYVAVNPQVQKVSGEYFANCKVTKPSGHARNAKLAERLIEVSDQLAADYL